MPVGPNKKRYFAWIGPERKHIHLGFEYGVLMNDPDRVLEGAHIRLRRVRYLTFEASDALDVPALVELTRESARVAALSKPERLLLALEREVNSERRAPAPRTAGRPG
jgi:hypothetical protein